MDELRKDVDELQKLLDQATRPRIKDILTIELRKIETDLKNKEEAIKKNESGEATETDASKPTTDMLKTKQPRIFTVQEKNYAWDQSDKFMKIHAQLPEVQSVPSENITCEFSSRSFRLRVNGLKNKNHEWHVGNLMEEIIPDDSHYKVKSNSVVVMLKKKDAKTWPYVTAREKKASDSKKKPAIDDTKDPNDSLMEMLKQMYEDGDDEMKKSISKAWSESRQKQTII